MKFHPLFQTFLVEALENQTRGSQLASSEWKRAGCPVVEEEPRSARQWVMENIEPLERAAQYVSKLETDLAAANARIAELEKSSYPQVFDPGRQEYVSIRWLEQQARNAALEEAANAAEGWVEQPESTFSRLADSIRRLKK